MKKFNLCLLASAALLASTGVQAQWQGNWLLGVSAGGAWHSGDDDFDLTITDGALTDTFALNTDNDESHFIWGFLGGYQVRCNGWLFGAEVNVDWRGDNDDESFAFGTPGVGILGTGIGTISRDNDPVVGLTARMGYEVTPFFMPYIRLGVDYGGRDADFTVTTTDLVNNFTVTAHNDDDRWGFVGGIGAEFPVPVIAGLSLRAEWNYHSRHHDNDDVAVLAPNGTTLFTFSNDNGHEQTARASLVFNFPA